ncbi:MULTISPECIES: hypothetical protein [Microcystis]|nr:MULTISPECIES: hypothetical protein [Microcystis]CCI31402.1 hypothetical protein MICAI_1930002 [Microcystis sp. T1-4]
MSGGKYGSTQYYFITPRAEIADRLDCQIATVEDKIIATITTGE